MTNGEPKSNATRGSGDGCSDCPPLKSLDGRVDRMEAHLVIMDSRLGKVELGQAEHSFQLKNARDDLSKVIRWLEGANGANGFKSEWIRFSARMDSLSTSVETRTSWVSRAAWIALGAVILGTLRLAYAIAEQFIQGQGP